MTPGPDQLHALLPDGRRGSLSTDVSDNEGDYFIENRGSTDTRQDLGNFFERANRTIAKNLTLHSIRLAASRILVFSFNSRCYGSLYQTLLVNQRLYSVAVHITLDFIFLT